MEGRDPTRANHDLPRCSPASDATLDNLHWYVHQAANADPVHLVGLWVQIANYVPSALARLRKTEEERDAVVAGLHEFRECQQRLLALAYLAAAKGETIDPHQLIAYLTGTEGA